MKRMIIVIAIVALFIGVIYAGFLPGLSLLNIETTTDNRIYRVDNQYSFQDELLGPLSRKGYIRSYTNDGMSEVIECGGKIKAGGYSNMVIHKYKYLIYGKENKDWELIAKPGSTTTYLTQQCPSPKAVNWLQSMPGYANLDEYEFQYIGNKHNAIKAVLYGYVDWNMWNPLDTWSWTVLASDEAFLYEGFGGLTFDTDTQGLPINTYEIGESGRIHVETTYGGGTVGEGSKSWEVIMRYPEDRGGTVLKKQSYGDLVKTYFEFDVTAEMFSKDSNNEYSITLYNTILPKAEVRTRTIDVKAKAPGDVVYSGPVSVKNGDNINLELSASVNAQTQLPIKYFRVGIYYGSSDSSIPTSPFSNRWIIPVVDTHDVSQSGSKYFTNINFKPDKPKYEGFITAWAVAYDTEGRGSLHSEKWTLYVWVHSNDGGSGEPPDETIEDETGQDHDYGGRSEPWLPWDPSGGTWEEGDIEDYLPLILAIAVFIIMLIIAFIPQMPIPYGITGRLLVVVLGAALAVLVYCYMGGDMGGIV